MKREIEFTVILGSDDRYRHRHIRERGEIVYFRIQLETMIGDKSYPVVRYDTSHGFAHRDLISRKGDVTKTPVFIYNYNDALTFAEGDLKANWEIYKERFLKE